MSKKKIIAIQADPLNSVNIKTDTTFLLALEAQKRFYKIYWYETKDLNFGQGLFIMVAGGLGMVVPTPTGLGSYHYLVIKALISLNISRQIAQFFAIIVHSSQAIMIIITGFFAMIFLYCRKK